MNLKYLFSITIIGLLLVSACDSGSSPASPAPAVAGDELLALLQGTWNVTGHTPTGEYYNTATETCDELPGTFQLYTNNRTRTIEGNIHTYCETEAGNIACNPSETISVSGTTVTITHSDGNVTTVENVVMTDNNQSVSSEIEWIDNGCTLVSVETWEKSDSSSDDGGGDDGGTLGCVVDHSEWGAPFATCDEAWTSLNLTCEYLETTYQANCTGCECPGD
tara:strand:+ start:1050 stop:1712 length:663 start_codon:yes stop_codon:yes gene_type:complete